ncbi:hypothetical protein RHGRI_018164 [Rhododendron griersonianum]|uniref:Galactose oxidase/kelch repeat superfamily protein n=1 Tax=Rhododendron griersonianum TaxID=479676 RepID=A0AAV6K0M1_9ERIC|nr:hypothetical protein RHGRI_018164 [Rhododendron griersonianum]
MNTTSAEEGQQPCSWIPKQKTHLKLVYICIQKRPTPDSLMGEDDFLYEWVVDKDMMMMTSEEEEEEEEEKGGGGGTAPPGDCWVEGTLTPALEKMPLMFSRDPMTNLLIYSYIDHAEEGQQPCSWIPKQKTHLKLVYICIQKRPTPDSLMGEDDFLYEWVVDKDMMMMTSEEEEEEEGGGGTAPPGDCWVEGTLTPALEKMPLMFSRDPMTNLLIYSYIDQFVLVVDKDMMMMTSEEEEEEEGGEGGEEGWKRGPDLKHGRFKGTAAALSGRIYMFGGTSYFLDSEKQCSERPYTEVLDAASDSWISLSPAPPTLAYYKGNDHLNEVFVPAEVYGARLLPDGRILLHSVCSIVSYDVQADSFSFFDDDFGRVACNGAVLLDGVLFFYREERGVFGYDVVNRKWFPFPVRGLRNGTVLPYDDEFPIFLLHLGGGRLCIGKIDFKNVIFLPVFFFDVARPEEDWKRGSELNCGRFHGSAAAPNGRIYVFGGINFGDDSVVAGTKPAQKTYEASETLRYDDSRSNELPKGGKRLPSARKSLSSSSMVSSTFFNGRFVAESSFDGATSVTNLAFNSLPIVQAMRTIKNLPALDTERVRRRKIMIMVEMGCWE